MGTVSFEEPVVSQPGVPHALEIAREGSPLVRATGLCGLVGISRGNKLVPNPDRGSEPVFASQIRVFTEPTTLSSWFLGTSHKPFNVPSAVFIRCGFAGSLSSFVKYPREKGKYYYFYTMSVDVNHCS